MTTSPPSTFAKPPRPPRNPLSLSIMFPCYNEEGNVERMTRAALAIAEKVAVDFEVVIVNDGSRDRTGAIADQLAAQHADVVRVVHNNPNRGYGGALKAGFLACRKEWVFYTDGDAQFDLNELPLVLPLLAEFDIVTCFRRNRRDPLHRKVNAALWGALVNFLFGLRIRDVDCAFKIYPRHLFRTIVMLSDSALIDTEVLAKARNRGYTMTQIGVTHYPRVAGAQTGAKLSSIYKAFCELLRLYYQIRTDGRRD